MRLSFLQKIVSLFYPLKIKKSSGKENPVLELFYYQGQWQLATQDAIYSDGNRYRPITLAFDKLSQQLPAVKNVLMLGAGLGSVLNILDKRKLHPFVTLVEIDAQIIAWAKELLPQHWTKQTQFICGDAALLMKHNTTAFDMVIVDIFNSRTVPDFVVEEAFLNYCKNAVNENGVFILNYIIHEKKHWETALQNIKSQFPNVSVYELGVNRIVIAKV